MMVQLKAGSKKLYYNIFKFFITFCETLLPGMLNTGDAKNRKVCSLQVLKFLSKSFDNCQNLNMVHNCSM